MKTFTTLTAAAALIAGLSIAHAQNAGGPAKPDASPSNINKGVETGSGTSQSGTESTDAASPKGKAAAKKSGMTTGAGSNSADNPPPSSLNAGGRTDTSGSRSGSQMEKK